MLTQTLTDAQREALVAQLDTDGYVILPEKLPDAQVARLTQTIDRLTHEIRGEDSRRSVKVMDCASRDDAFLELAMHTPALQLCYDLFGPMFHLCQSNFVSRPNDGTGKSDFISASPWHADGPRPGLFPKVNGVMGLHYLKFGYFLTDLRHGNGGSLQVVRGSHKRPELDGKGHGAFHIEDYADDLVQIDCEPGTVIAFHQAQWHAAPPNESPIERKNLYISYCPTWMRPLDREFPTEEQLQGRTPEERWILGEPRPSIRWWLPQGNDAQRMARFRRASETPVGAVRNYD